MVMGMFVFFPGFALQRMQNSDKEEFLRHDTDIEWGADSRGVYITQIVQYEWTVCSRAFFVVARPALMLARLTRSFLSPIALLASSANYYTPYNSEEFSFGPLLLPQEPFFVSYRWLLFCYISCLFLFCFFCP